MKVLHFISGGDTGGAKAHVLTLLEELNNKIDARLLCIMESEFTDEAKELGIPITIIHQKKRYNIFIINKIVQMVKKEGFDIIHCHGARANFIAIFLKPWLNIPIITTIHSDYKLDFVDNKYKNLVYTPMNSLALRLLEYYIAITNNFKEMLANRGFDRSKIFVAYNGISFKGANGAIKSPEEFLGSYQIPYDPEKKYVGVAARLYAVKGIDVFLKGAKDLSKKRKDVVFLIAGDGEKRDEYENYVNTEGLSDIVYFLGHVEDIHSFYNAIDINTLTSYSESYPYALLEGATHRKATVASAVGGIPEMLEHEKTGLLFKSGDHLELAKDLEKLIDNKELRESLGDAFYLKAKSSYSVDKMIETHINIYEKIIKESKYEDNR